MSDDRRGSRLVVGLAAYESRCHLLDSSADWHVHELTRVDDALTRITQGMTRCLPRLPRFDCCLLLPIDPGSSWNTDKTITKPIREIRQIYWTYRSNRDRDSTNCHFFRYLMRNRFAHRTLALLTAWLGNRMRPNIRSRPPKRRPGVFLFRQGFARYDSQEG
jgi:hypothetical protein